MWKIGITCLLSAAILGLAASVAHAVELQNFRLLDQPKKVRIEFSFSAATDPDIVNDFNANIISLKDPQWEFSKQQLSKDHRLEADQNYDILRFVRFNQDEAYGEIRVYVGWKVSPADAQIIRGDKVLVVEIVKPFWLTEGTPAEEGTESQPADGDTSAGEGDSGTEVAIEDGEDTGNAGDSPGEMGSPPGGLRDTEWPEQGTDEAGEAGGEESGADEPAGNTTTDTAEDTANSGGDTTVHPTGGKYSPKPSYRNFNLDEVPVRQLEFYNEPFDKALMELVAGCGFNVVLAEGIDSKVMTLNFTQRELSLKRALDLLSMAYDISYTVEDDAILIAPNS